LTTITDRRLWAWKFETRNPKFERNPKNEIPKSQTQNGAIPSGRAWKSPSVQTPLGTELKPKPVEVKWHDSPKRCLIFADAASRKDTLYPPGQGITSRKRCRSDAGRRTPFDNLEQSMQQTGLSARPGRHAPALLHAPSRPQTTSSQTLLTNLFITLNR